MTLIMGADSELIDVVQAMAAERGATNEFVELFIPAIYRACDELGVDAVYVVAQSMKETAGGRFNGTVPRWFNNTSGLKVHPDEQERLPEGLAAGNALWAHQRFPTVLQGARAQVQHLRAYAKKPVPEDQVIAPRTLYVARRGLHSREWEGISWAGPNYGREVVRLGLMLIETGL